MANIKISNEQYNRLFNKNKEIVISESQYNRVFSLLTLDDGSVENVGNINESISYNPTGSRAKPEIDMSINNDTDDKYNLAQNNADTRVFGNKSMLDYTSDGSTTLREKYLILNITNKMYKKAINYAWYKGRRRIILPTDEECTLNGQLRN